MSHQVLKATDPNKRPLLLESGGAAKGNKPALPGENLATAGVHPSAIQIGLGGVVWFLAVTWLYFVWGPHDVNLDLAVAAGFFVMLFMLFLVQAPRWLHDSESDRWTGPSAGLGRRDDPACRSERTRKGR